MLTAGIARFASAQTGYLLYTANVSGTIENCACGSHPLGGMDRLKTFVDEFKKNHPGSILIDGGDFFNSYPFPELNKAMLNVLNHMDYDVLVPGEHEFTVNNVLLSAYFSQYGQKVLISNSGLTDRSFREFKTDRFLIKVYSYLDPGVFKFIPEPDTLKLSKTPFKVQAAESPDMMNILVFHGEKNVLQEILSRSPSVDLVLLAHMQNKGQSQIAGKMVIGVGRDGESVAVIRLFKEADDLHVEVDFQTIDLSLAADKDILPIIHNFKSKNRTH
jgi:hypothetical protein